MTPKEALAKVLSICNDNQTELAARIGKGQSIVGKWVTRDERVGHGFVIAVSEAVQWQVTPHELRPDLYPHPDDGLPVQLRSVASAA